MEYNKEKLQRMLYIQLENLDVYAEKINILKAKRPIEEGKSAFRKESLRSGQKASTL